MIRTVVEMFNMKRRLNYLIGKSLPQDDYIHSRIVESRWGEEKMRKFLGDYRCKEGNRNILISKMGMEAVRIIKNEGCEYMTKKQWDERIEYIKFLYHFESKIHKLLAEGKNAEIPDEDVERISSGITEWQEESERLKWLAMSEDEVKNRISIEFDEYGCLKEMSYKDDDTTHNFGLCM